MTAFIVAAIAMVVIAIAWILWPLLRRSESRTVDHGAANVSIFRDQFADLEADLARGTLSPEQYSESKTELERRLLDDVRASGAAPDGRRSHRWIAVVVALITPLAAAALYLQVGSPAGLSPGTALASNEGEVTRERIETMITDLKKRLDKEPTNAETWALLARTQYAVGNFSEAAAAYAKVSALLPENADLIADYADALAMSQGRTFTGRPLELVRRALVLNPKQWKALAMAGSEAFERRDYVAAIDYWQRLHNITPPEAPIAQQLQGSIDRARELAGSSVPPPLASGFVEGAPTRSSADGRTVTGTVTLSAALMSKVQPDDSVFIFARPADGSRMPVAVVRARAKELPLQFTLDDSRAMAPTAKISNLAEVIVTARVSRSGNAIPASGDLEGGTEKIKVGSQGVAITIDRAVP